MIREALGANGRSRIAELANREAERRNKERELIKRCRVYEVNLVGENTRLAGREGLEYIELSVPRDSLFVVGTLVGRFGKEGYTVSAFSLEASSGTGSSQNFVLSAVSRELDGVFGKRLITQDDVTVLLERWREGKIVGKIEGIEFPAFVSKSMADFNQVEGSLPIKGATICTVGSRLVDPDGLIGENEPGILRAPTSKEGSWYDFESMVVETLPEKIRRIFFGIEDVDDAIKFLLRIPRSPADLETFKNWFLGTKMAIPNTVSDLAAA